MFATSGINVPHGTDMILVGSWTKVHPVPLLLAIA